MDSSPPQAKSSGRRVATASNKRSYFGRLRLIPAVGIALAMLVVAGCGDEAVGTAFTLTLSASSVDDNGRCTGSEDGPLTFLTTPPDLARLTFRQADGGAFMCDALLTVGDSTVVGVPNVEGPVDVFVELYRSEPGGVELVASGGSRAEQIESTQPLNIRITMRDSFSCAGPPLNTGRAFHSATRLPDGRVLLLGGVVSASTDDVVDFGTSAPLLVTSSAEIYDPRTHSVRLVSIPGFTARAFHKTHVLSVAGDSIVLAMIGGISVATDPATSGPLSVAAPGQPLRWMPSLAASPAPTEIITFTPSTLTGTVERVPAASDLTPRVFAAITPSGQGAEQPLTAGGWTDRTAQVALSSADVLDPVTGTLAASAALRIGRIGASVTVLTDGRALVWGGHLTTGLADDAGELISGLMAGGQPTSLALVFLVTPAVRPRSFHAAAATGDSVLVVGGFEIAGGLALTPEPNLAQRVDVSTSLIEDVSVVGGGGGVPAGYLTATAIGERGDVLVAGGNPLSGFGGCDTSQAGLLCSLATSYRYRASTSVLEPLASNLLVSRYGHRATKLLDGTVLMSGGLHAIGASLQVISDLEIYDPRDEEFDPIADLIELERLPGETATTAGNTTNECSIIE